MKFSVDTINGHPIHSAVMIDSNQVMVNSNHSTGPSPVAIDQKRLPGPIGSERKRQIPTPADRSTIGKREKF